MAAIEPVTYKTDLKKRARTANISYPVHLGVRRAACRTTPEGMVHHGSLPKAQGQRSIQIDGLRVPCVLLQTAGDQDGLVFRSWRQARAAPIS